MQKKSGEFDVEWKTLRRAVAAPLQDTYSARHLPNGKLTAFGRKMKLKELADKAKKEAGRQ